MKFLNYIGPTIIGIGICLLMISETQDIIISLISGTLATISVLYLIGQ